MAIKHLVAVDPGDKNNGFCYFKYNTETRIADLRIQEVLDGKGMSGTLRTLYEVNRDREVAISVQADNPSQFYFVVENFRVDTKVRGAMFQWNDMATSQMIGRVRLCAEWMGAPVFTQEPAILGMARKWAPFKLPKGHIPDEKSAWLHGAHFMMDKNWINTTDQIHWFGQEQV